MEAMYCNKRRRTLGRRQSDWFGSPRKFASILRPSQKERRGHLDEKALARACGYVCAMYLPTLTKGGMTRSCLRQKQQALVERTLPVTVPCSARSYSRPKLLVPSYISTMAEPNRSLTFKSDWKQRPRSISTTKI